MSNDYWNDPFCRRNPYSMINQYEQTFERLGEQREARIEEGAALAEMLNPMKRPEPILPDCFPVSTTPTFPLHPYTTRVISSGTPKKKKAPVLPRVLFWAVLFTLFGLAAFRLLMPML